MQRHRLLTTHRDEAGSSLVDAVFAMVILLVLVLGAIQVGLFLYARNVLLSSTHEGARAAVELGRTPAEAAAIARRTVHQGAGALVDGLRIEVTSSSDAGVTRYHVAVSGALDPPGIVPFGVVMSARATSSRADP